MLNTKDYLNKFDSTTQNCIVLGYSELSKGYRVYNIEIWIVDESIHAKFDDKSEPEKLKLVKKFADLKITY